MSLLFARSMVACWLPRRVREMHPRWQRYDRSAPAAAPCPAPESPARRRRARTADRGTCSAGSRSHTGPATRAQGGGRSGLSPPEQGPHHRATTRSAFPGCEVRSARPRQAPCPRRRPTSSCARTSLAASPKHLHASARSASIIFCRARLPRTAVPSLLSISSGGSSSIVWMIFSISTVANMSSASTGLR